MSLDDIKYFQIAEQFKKVEAIRQAKILQAEGDAEAIRLVNEAAEKYFIGNAQILRRI
jgi:regulator of protease activity HflC (stomatin/prohibitin superfamily)